MTKARIFLFFCLALIGGIGIRSFYSIPLFGIFVVGLLLLVILFVFGKNVKVRLILLAGLFLLVGVLRYEISEPKVNERKIQFYNEQKVEFQGLVAKEPDVRWDQVKLTIESEKVWVKDKEIAVSGQVLVSTALYPEYQYGDELKIFCQLQTPEVIEDFAYDQYLARYDIYSLCWQPRIKLIGQKGSLVFNFIFRLKKKFKSVIDQILAEPENSLFSAMFLGMKREVSSELREQFSRCGLSHLIAISGLHITLIVTLLMNLGLALSLSRRWAFCLASLILVFYIILVGLPASAIRAGIMGFLVLLAYQIGRLNRSVNSIVFAATCMLLINPKILRADIGFQLSFSAVLGIIYFSPFLEKILRRLPDFFQIKSSLTMTTSAQVLTLPLIVYHFKRFSLVALLANILVLPLIPFIIVSGLLTGILGLIWLPLGQVASWLPWLILKYLILIAQIFSGWQFSALELSQVSWWTLPIIYSVLGWIIFKLNKKVC